MTDVSTGPVGTAPYADATEHAPWVVPPVAPITYPPFQPTDARAVEIYLEPLHFNLFPNPSFRTDATGWTVDPGLILRQDSWVGQSVEFNSPGHIQHDKIWVGPEYLDLSGDRLNWPEVWKTRLEYTVSLWAKGSQARLRVSLYGYRPKVYGVPNPVPEDTPSVQVHSPRVLVTSNDWERVWVKTTSRLSDISGGTSDFSQCWWVVPYVEVSADSLRASPYVLLSSFLLDPTEGPLCDYFDGDMSEGGARDDFIWLRDRAGDVRFSAYYPQRVERCRWLYNHMHDVIPVNRPVHVYYHDRANPWDPGGPPPHELTGSLRTNNADGPSMVESAISRYGDLVNPLP